jgi:hypothetical protein
MIRWSLEPLLNLLARFGLVVDPGGLGINYVQFNTALGQGDVTHNVGRVHWNSADGTLEFGMLGGEVVLQVGQEHLIRVFNQTGDPIPNGSLCYIVSAGDQKPRVDLADADNTNPVPEAVVMGMATELIANGDQGYITSAGLVRDLDTDALTEGAPVWLSTTPGGFTETKPTSPNRGIFIGHCIYKHNSNGIILININPIPPLIGLSDVLSAPPNDGDILVWVASNSRFELQQPS